MKNTKTVTIEAPPSANGRALPKTRFEFAGGLEGFAKQIGSTPERVLANLERRSLPRRPIGRPPGAKTRFWGINADARALGVSVSHLYNVLTGRRENPELFARYAALPPGPGSATAEDAGMWSRYETKEGVPVHKLKLKKPAKA